MRKKLNPSLMLQAIAVVGLSISSPVTPCRAQSSWNTYQGNASHNGYVPVSVNPSEQVAWNATLPALFIFV